LTAWIRKFVTQNLGLLLSSNNRTAAIRLKKKEFFHKNQLKSSDSFTLRELAFEVLKHLIDLSKIKTEEDIRKFKESSVFLKEYVTEHDVDALSGLITPFQSSVLSADDLGKLEQEEYRQVIEQELLAKARKAAEEQLEKNRKKTLEEMQIEQKRLEELRILAKEKLEEVKKFETILDSLPTSFNPEDYITPEKEKEVPSGNSWWQRTGLTGDPFPTNRGLYQIPVDKYEKIIVATKIFRDYIRLVQDSPNSLFGKTILISGQFGSGKTTLLQYLSYKLVPSKISPILIGLDPEGDADLIRRNFYTEIFSFSCKTMKQLGVDDPRTKGKTPERNTIANLLLDIAEQSHIDGFMLMIDGLHKGESNVDACLEFVKQLQNFQEYLENYGINVCFLVVGSILWLRKIQQNPAYSGSFFRTDEVPRLTFNDAYELLQRRVDAFAIPGTPIFLDKGTIKFAYDSLYKDLGERITFRDFIDYILPRLASGDLKSVGISVQIDLENADKIHRELGSSVIKDAYAYFRATTKGKKKLRKACYAALRNIYKSGYVTEQNELVKFNKGAFYILRNSRLIQATRTSEGLGWSISDEFLSVLDDLNEQGYPPPVVFQSLSIEPSEPSEKNEPFDLVLESAKNFLATWESEWPEIVVYAKGFVADHEKILKNSGMCDTSQECRGALLKIIQCAQIILKNKSAPEEWLRSTWLDIPERETIDSVLHPETLSNADPLILYQRYYRSVSVLIENIGRLLEINRLTHIVSLQSGAEEMKTVFTAGNYLKNGDFEKALEEINSKIEQRIRVIFHIAFSLHFGNDYLSHLPKYIQDRVLNSSSRGPKEVKRPPDSNIFYHFSRSEYSEVVSDSNNWNSFFSSIFAPKKKDEVVTALRLTFSLDDRKQHRDRPDYFRSVRESIRQAVSNAGWLLNSLAKGLELALSPNGYSEKSVASLRIIKVSFVSQDRCLASFSWGIEARKETEITYRLTKLSSVVNFSDDLTVSNIFGGSFTEVILVINILLRKGLLSIEKQPENGMYIRINPVPPRSKSTSTN